ncbi:hypothetical protein [Fontibacillus sp. BL9]|uniref:hypothetical protein n=1 Tax=Fontibacillus sp. BL9 TaxID=3389971 RepID=UPI00397D5FE5
MIRFGVFSGPIRNSKPEPLIIKTNGVEVKPEFASKIATSPKKKQIKNSPE